MGVAYLLLGTNLGNRESNLLKALNLLKNIGTIKCFSSVYETEPWGFTDERKFLNETVSIDTPLNPFELLIEIQKIETTLGRKRNAEQWCSREIDIDILFYNDIILNEKNLFIPHPQLAYRRFALIPLNEIAPCFVHPVLNKSISEILNECIDNKKVELYHSFSFKNEIMSRNEI